MSFPSACNFTEKQTPLRHANFVKLFRTSNLHLLRVKKSRQKTQAAKIKKKK